MPSNLTAVAYYGGIPSKNNNPEKPLILDNFLEGVKKSGDNAIGHTQMSVVPADVALIQGFVHEHGKTAPHLRLRKEVYDTQIMNGKRALIVDSNLFLYADEGNTKRYLRYSYDGVFPTTGFYFDQDIDPNRWQKISKDLNLNLKPWRTQGNHILICLQRNGGWSMGGLAVQTWLDQTISIIRSFAKKRPIVVRLHPGDKKMPRMLRINHKNVTISRNKNIRQDLQNAWACITYNSSPGVASAIEGVPVFVTDPIPSHSQCMDVANFDLSQIENPIMPERQSWIEKISMCHWNFDELKNGDAWNFFKKYI